MFGHFTNKQLQGIKVSSDISSIRTKSTNVCLPPLPITVNYDFIYRTRQKSFHMHFIVVSSFFFPSLSEHQQSSHPLSSLPVFNFKFMGGGCCGRLERGSWRAALLFNSEHLIFPWHILVGSGFALQPLINFRVLSRRAGSTGKPHEISARRTCVSRAGRGAAPRAPRWLPPIPCARLSSPAAGPGCVSRRSSSFMGTAIICLCWLPGPAFWAGARAVRGRGKDEPLLGRYRTADLQPV